MQPLLADLPAQAPAFVAWYEALPPRFLKALFTRSLRTIAAELAALGHLAPSGQPYHASNIRHMLAA